MFGFFKKKEKPRVFLGALAVAPRKDLKRWLEDGVLFGGGDMDASMRTFLTEVFPLPAAESVAEPRDNDFAIDVVVLHFQSGSTMLIDASRAVIPVFWRPRVEVRSRVYRLSTGETVKTFAATQKMPWPEFAWRSVKPEVLVDIVTPFGASDLQILLYKACLKLLAKMDKAVKKGL